MTGRPFFVYSARDSTDFVLSFGGEVVREIVTRHWFLNCRICNTYEFIGLSPDRAHDHAITHAKWWHGAAIFLRFVGGSAY